MEYTLSVTDSSSNELKQAIMKPLIVDNIQRVGPSNHRFLAVPITDGEKKVIGGLYGHTAYGWLFIELLIVPEFLRGNGLGKQLVQTAEQEAIARGCHSARIDTYEFQAKSFYEELGYEIFGELPHYPQNYSRYFLKKTL